MRKTLTRKQRTGGFGGISGAMGGPGASYGLTAQQIQASANARYEREHEAKLRKEWAKEQKEIDEKEAIRYKKMSKEVSEDFHRYVETDDVEKFQKLFEQVSSYYQIHPTKFAYYARKKAYKIMDYMLKVFKKYGNRLLSKEYEEYVVPIDDDDIELTCLHYSLRSALDMGDMELLKFILDKYKIAMRDKKHDKSIIKEHLSEAVSIADKKKDKEMVNYILNNYGEFVEGTNAFSYKGPANKNENNKRAELFSKKGNTPKEDNMGWEMVAGSKKRKTRRKYSA